MEMCFFAKTRILIHIQNLVKKFDGRFKYNPLVMGERSQVILTFEDVHKANEFGRMLNITEQVYF